MSKKNLYLLGIVAVIALGTFMYRCLCSGCLVNTIQEQQELDVLVVPQNEIGTPLYPFALSDGKFSLNMEENFNFHASNPSFLMPISKDLKEGVEALKDYLLANDSSQVTIIGHFMAKEENNTPFSNLGLARAHSVKNHFIMTGIPDDQISVLGKMDDEISGLGNILAGAVSYSLTRSVEEQ